MEINELFAILGLDVRALAKGDLIVRSPIDGAEIARLRTDSPADVDGKIALVGDAFLEWRRVPAPRRGELIRLFGEQLRALKDPLGRLVAVECGKILQEGLGEVQEMIDICDFAVGLSRQLHGLTIACERPGHRMMETWHPLGPVGVITAFNFPVAVWAWNFALALVCGDPVVWKPSEKTPLTALACQALFGKALARFGEAPPGLSLVAARFGRSLLELGGNNAMIVAPSADLDLAVRAILFAAVATAGQRCTTLRRLIVHENIYDDLVPRLKSAYRTIAIGDPLDAATLVGPLIEMAAGEAMEEVLARVAGEGGTVFGGERVLEDRYPDACYVNPAIIEMPEQTDTVAEETFAPVLCVMKYRDLKEAIAIHNRVAQGLSSSIFTTDLREAEIFLSAEGSDCGIANVNIGPSGAEIGGAFGGEKETGGGREAGSDAWKNYMRRATNTVNYSNDLPLAQGISFAED